MINRIVITGRLTKDSDLRYSPQGTAVNNFTVAVTRAFDREKADFPNVVAFKKLAENVANFTSKGSLVAVDGRLQTRSYENNEGRKVYVTEIVADSVQFLDPKGSNQGNQQPQSQPQSNDPFSQDGKPIDISDDDLPF